MKKTKKHKNCEKSVYFGDFALSMTINFYHFFEIARFGISMQKVFS